MVSEPKAVARRRKLRDSLIHAAERTIAKEGLRGLKAGDLATKVGCAVGAIYNVFADLDDLIFAVNALTLEQLEKTLTVAGAKGADRQADAIRALTQLALAYTDYAAANRPRWRALFDHRLPRGGARAARARAFPPPPRGGKGGPRLVPGEPRPPVRLHRGASAQARA